VDTVFYSWQSDLPNATNRGFVQQALETAAKALRADDSLRVEPVIDRDTQGVAGSPDIASTIFSKIAKAQVFVCDVSIIGRVPNADPDRSPRPTPNPNVLVEFGFAIRALGWDRIIMVCNTAYGPTEELPFDLRPRRIASYHMSMEEDARAPERKKLERSLESALREVFAQASNEQDNRYAQATASSFQAHLEEHQDYWERMRLRVTHPPVLDTRWIPKDYDWEELWAWAQRRGFANRKDVDRFLESRTNDLSPQETRLEMERRLRKIQVPAESWAAFWDWGRRLLAKDGVTSRDELAQLLGRPLGQLRPWDAQRELLEEYGYPLV
jgi:hypothetical protein